MREDQKRLADALEELKDHNFMKIHESPIKFIYYNLLRGLAIGLGSVVGATLLVSILVACLLYTSPSPRDKRQSRMPSSA